MHIECNYSRVTHILAAKPHIPPTPARFMTYLHASVMDDLSVSSPVGNLRRHAERVGIRPFCGEVARPGRRHRFEPDDAHRVCCRNPGKSVNRMELPLRTHASLVHVSFCRGDFCFAIALLTFIFGKCKKDPQLRRRSLGHASRCPLRKVASVIMLSPMIGIPPKETMCATRCGHVKCRNEVSSWDGTTLCSSC